MARFLTVNVRGLRDANKRSSFLQWLSQSTVDFACLQETHVPSSAECTSWFSPFGFQAVASPGTAFSCGSVLLFRPKYVLRKSLCDSSGRFVLAEFELNGIVFRVVCLYAPNQNPARDDFFQFVSDTVDPAIPTVLCGDFNAVFSRPLDRRGPVPPNPAPDSSVSLQSLFNDCCVVDIWRYLHPNTAAFTWMRSDGTLSSRIDLIGCPIPWVHCVKSCEILPCPYSDHSAVLLVCPIPTPLPRGPGRWKMNISILKEQEFVSLVEDFWKSWRLRKPSSSLHSWWDRGKEHIKSIAIRFCLGKQAERKTSRSLYTALACHLKSHIDAGRISFLDVYEKVLKKISELDSFEAEGARIRSRVRWAEEGEMSSKYFLRLEKKRGTSDWITAMRRSDGSLATDISSICSSWVDFYSSLFSAGSIDLSVQDDLLNSLSSRLPPAACDSCEGPLTVGEGFQALDGMADVKSPGSDGLSKEFYRTFWGILGADLVDVLNDSFASGSLPFSLRGALICLIFKKGDRLDHKNWRPISLLNVDYKLCARALAGRLLKVLHLVIGPDQTCGVRGRYIGENVAFLRDLVEFTSETKTPAAILSLDQEKAFDRVDWAFLFRTLSRFGFGPTFISWVGLLYTDVRSTVLLNGYSSDFFRPSRGVRQGCPLSPLLYVISIEVLAVNLRAHPDIVGLRPPGLSTSLPVLSLYADDTSVVAASDSAILAVFDTYGKFEKGTGSKLNLGKCEGLWLGPWRFRSASTSVDIAWTSSKIKVLGVYIGHGDLAEANWRPRIDAVSRCLDAWRSRALSLSGKALIVNALALSRVWYVASLVHMPPWVRTELNRLVFKFLWSGKPDLVCRNVMFHPKEAGGFSVVSIDFKVSSLLVQWVRRLVVCPNGWVFLLKYWLLDRLGVSPVAFLSSPSSFPSASFPPFYSALFRSWSALGGSMSSSGLVFGGSVGGPFPVNSMSCKFVYSLFLKLNPAVPNCVSKFFPSFGALYWPATWSSLFFLPLDRKVSDLNWKIAHGVLYTAERISSWCPTIPLSCFCGFQLESLEHLFFFCPLVQSGYAWVQTQLSRASPLAPSISLRHALFGFSSDEMRCVPRVFCYLLNVCKYLVWLQRNDHRFRSEPPSAVHLISGIKARLRFYLPLYFKRFNSSRRRKYFLRQWGGNGVFGHISGSSFVCSF